MAKIIMPDGVQPFDLEDEIAGDDEALRAALAVAYPDAKNAQFKRETKDGVLSVRVIKKAGTKGGGVLADLLAAPEEINPAIVLERELTARQLAGDLTHLDILAMRSRIEQTVAAGEAEVAAAASARRSLQQSPAVAATTVPKGF